MERERVGVSPFVEMDLCLFVSSCHSIPELAFAAFIFRRTNSNSYVVFFFSYSKKKNEKLIFM